MPEHIIHGPIGVAIADLDPADQARARAQAHEALGMPPSKTSWTTSAGVTITITKGPWYEAVGESGLLGLELAASHDGVDIPLDNPFYFVNPPIVVPNGTTFYVPTDDLPVLVQQHEENVEQAFYLIVGDVVENIYRRGQ